MQDTSVQNFFAFMRERHAIYLRRFVEKAPPPWTDDPILREYSFTNVYRELDKTTVWFRENIRDHFKEDPRAALFSTILFRWFNKIETGKAMLSMKWPDITNEDARLVFHPDYYDRQETEKVLRPLPRWVTGAYIIKTPDGMDKLQGVLSCVQNAHDAASRLCYYIQKRPTLENAHTVIKSLPFMGDFMAYEVVTDLRHTPLLENAPDIMTWANPGPGAMRGVNRLLGEDLNKKRKRDFYIDYMKELLFQSRTDRFVNTTLYGPEKILPAHWPNNEQYPPLEMRDIEHSLCEFDKYERVRLGEGRPKQKFRSAQNFSLQV